MHFFSDSQGLFFACSKDNYLYLDDVVNSRVQKKPKLVAEGFYAQDLNQSKGVPLGSREGGKSQSVQLSVLRCMFHQLRSR